jgi:uncharacterized membrane protein SpoIIM required for sporulation
MVYDRLFSSKWLRKHPINIFMLGFIFSELGIISAIIVFPQNVSMMSLAFTSLLLFPPLSKMLTREANLEFREKKFNLRLIFKDHKELFEIYFFLFLGILLSYAFFATVLTDVQLVTLFEGQIGVPCNRESPPYYCREIAGLTGQAYSTAAAQFWSIVSNNMVVMIVALVFSLAYGAGSILFLTWNASVWGTIFGFVAKVTSTGTPLAAISNFLHLFVRVLPHTAAEASAYFMAVIAGGVLSKALLRSDINEKQLKHVLFDSGMFFLLSIVLVFFSGWLEVYIFPLLNF